MERDGFYWLRYNLRGFQSDEARQVEADFRFDKLLCLIEDGIWDVDSAGNVVPVDMPEEDKRIVAERFEYCIINELPKETERPILRARGSIVDAGRLALVGSASIS